MTLVLTLIVALSLNNSLSLYDSATTTIWDSSESHTLQMPAYHQAAIKFTKLNSGYTGIIDNNDIISQFPSNLLSSIIRNKYESQADGTGLVITYTKGDLQNSGEITRRITNHLEGPRNFGTYDETNRLVRISGYPEINWPNIPPSMATSIPNNSPIFLTQVN